MGINGGPRVRMRGARDTERHRAAVDLSAFIIECAALYCYHQAWMEFDALGLPDELSSLDVTKHRRFVCTKCGPRKGSVHACWWVFSAPGNGVPPREV